MSRDQLIRSVEAIRRSPSVEIIHIDQATDSEAWELLANRLDKGWSLVDAASFILMQRLSLTEALTTDIHFPQAGFTRLLEP